MSSEIWQFAAFLCVAVVAFVLWLNIIYLPGRTLEHRYDGVKGFRHSSGKNPQDESDGEVSQNSSGQTR